MITHLYYSNIYKAKMTHIDWNEYCQLEFSNDPNSPLDLAMSNYNININYHDENCKLSIYRNGFNMPCLPHEEEPNET